MNSISVSNELAKNICNGGYRYLYGAKGQRYTTALVNQFAKAYPSVFTRSLNAEALKDADKGYVAIDCSGFVCKVLGIANLGSAQLRSKATKRFKVKKENAKPGMVLWKSGHVAYVGADLKIYEAQSTKTDMRVSTWEARSGAFKELLVVGGSALAATIDQKESNPYKEPAKTVTSNSQAKAKGCKSYISKGESVNWVQWELIEAGYGVPFTLDGKQYKGVTVDGVVGAITVAAIIAFQRSAKITDDGLAGKGTRAALKA